MARPARIEKLRHGRILCGVVFHLFVETWNWITAYVDNLRGDFEVNPKTGCIYIDRTDPDSPVIRFRDTRQVMSLVVADGPFSPIYDTEGEDDEVVTGFSNCYWQLAGSTKYMSDQALPGDTGFIALKAHATPSESGDATIECYESFADLAAAQRDVEYFIVPLYRVVNSKITLDMRRLPVVFTAEVLP